MISLRVKNFDIIIYPQGKLKNQSSDEFLQPPISSQFEEVISYPVTDYESTATVSLWYARVTVTKGGAAGKGPEPPEPPVMSTDGSAQYPNMMEELDGGESEGKTKMAFAKMQIPSNLREAYLLTDTDFSLNFEKDESSVTENELSSSDANLENNPIVDDEIDESNTQNFHEDSSVDRAGTTGSVTSVRSSRSPSIRSVARGLSLEDAMDSPNNEDKKGSKSKKVEVNSPGSPDTHARNKKKKNNKEANTNEQAAKLGLYA